MTGKLAGRRVVLTGAGRGVGIEVARRFLAEGAEVLGVGKDAARLGQATEQLARLGKFTSLVADLARPEAPSAIARAAQDRWNAVDILFNNAAIMVEGGRGFEQEPAGALEQSIEVNLLAPYRLTLAMLPLLRRGSEPRVVNVSSGAGNFESVGQTGIASYRVSKWALNGLTMAFATQLKGQIAVNAFDPGWVKTDMGGRNAPGSPVESAEGALALVTLPFAVTGKFWKDGGEIPF